MNHEELFDTLSHSRLQGLQVGLGDRPEEPADALATLPDPAAVGARAYLRTVRDMARSVENLRGEAEMYRSLSLRIAGSRDLISAICGCTDSRTSNTLLRCMMLMMQLSTRQQTLEGFVEEGSAFIDRLPDADIRTILRMRYLLGKSWKEICAQLYVSNSWARHLEHVGLKKLDHMARTLPRKKPSPDAVPWDETAPIPQKLPF